MIIGRRPKVPPTSRKIATTTHEATSNGSGNLPQGCTASKQQALAIFGRTRQSLMAQIDSGSTRMLEKQSKTAKKKWP